MDKEKEEKIYEAFEALFYLAITALMFAGALGTIYECIMYRG